MGDRYSWWEDCPKCKKKGVVECYDAPSCMQFSRVCRKCGWTDGLDYYETGTNEITLMTEADYRKWKKLNKKDKNK